MSFSFKNRAIRVICALALVAGLPLTPLGAATPAHAATVWAETNPVTVSASGGPTTVYIFTDQDRWNLIHMGGCDWIRINQQFGFDDSPLLFTTDPNPSASPRTATLYIQAGSAWEHLVVNQKGAAPTLTLSPTTLTLGTASGSSGTVTVTTNVSKWTASNIPSWVSVSPTSGVSGAKATVKTTSANTAASKRTGTITFTAGTLSKTVSVSQDGATVSASPAYVSWANTAGDTSVTITTNQPTWTATRGSNATWITMSPTSGSTGAKLKLTAGANTGTSARTGTITVKAGAATTTITVTQAGKVPPTLTVTPSSVTLGALSGTAAVVSVSTNQASWSIDSYPGWVSVKKTSSTQATITATTANPSTTSRIGSVAFSAGGLIRTVRVTQNAPAVVLYWDTNRGGSSWTTNYSGNLPSSWNDKASSMTVNTDKAVRLYLDSSYKGGYVDFTKGFYNLTDYGINDVISSILINPTTSPDITLYWDSSTSSKRKLSFEQSAGGPAFYLNGTAWDGQASAITVHNAAKQVFVVDDLGAWDVCPTRHGTETVPSFDNQCLLIPYGSYYFTSHGFNDQLTMLWIHPRTQPLLDFPQATDTPYVMLFEDVNQNPTADVWPVGNYPNFAGQVYNNLYSSLFVPICRTVEVWDYANYNNSGAHRLFTTGIYNLPNYGLNDKISSMKVKKTC
jgi:hypothetical protein